MIKGFKGIIKDQTKSLPAPKWETIRFFESEAEKSSLTKIKEIGYNTGVVEQRIGSQGVGCHISIHQVLHKLVNGDHAF